jgi:Phosphoesterase family
LAPPDNETCPAINLPAHAGPSSEASVRVNVLATVGVWDAAAFTCHRAPLASALTGEGRNGHDADQDARSGGGGLGRVDRDLGRGGRRGAQGRLLRSRSPAAAPQGGHKTPDGLNPGDCADNPLNTRLRAQGRGRGLRARTQAGPDLDEIVGLCPQYDPANPYPADCPNFDQLGFRAPLMVISPVAKRSYVSHAVADHTSLLALIEKRFLTGPDSKTQHLTERDGHAWTLEDMFDFKRSPSLSTAMPPPAPLPAVDCTPH